MAATIIFIVLLAVYIAISHSRQLRRLRAIEARMTRFESEQLYIHQKINEYETASKRMLEVVESNEEYLKQAMKTEQLMQDGINAIMNYDAMSFTKGDNK